LIETVLASASGSNTGKGLPLTPVGISIFIAGVILIIVIAYFQKRG
jgi:hypothetical protein